MYVARHARASGGRPVTGELIAILAVGATLLGVMVALFGWMRSDIGRVGDKVDRLGDRMGAVEGRLGVVETLLHERTGAPSSGGPAGAPSATGDPAAAH